MPTADGKPKIEFAHGRSLNASGDTIDILTVDVPVVFTAYDSTDQSVLGFASGVVTCPKGTFKVTAYAHGGDAADAVAIAILKSTDSGSTWTEVQDSQEKTGAASDWFLSAVVDCDDGDQLALGVINGTDNTDVAIIQTNFDVLALDTPTQRRKGAE